MINPQLKNKLEDVKKVTGITSLLLDKNINGYRLVKISNNMRGEVDLSERVSTKVMYQILETIHNLNR